MGGLRTALYNHLYAKKLGGKWILRIDDTDAVCLLVGLRTFKQASFHRVVTGIDVIALDEIRP